MVEIVPHDVHQQCALTFHVDPKEEQLDVVEHVGLGRDCILIAGCGWGKSLTYFLPMALWKHRTILVISPLKSLAQDQHSKLTNLKIPSIIIKGDTPIHSSLLRSLATGAYRAVFLSPEIIFSSRRLSSLWDMPEWRKRLLAVIVDEAHCITSWGDGFRKDYSKIGMIRSMVPPTTGFIAMSATLPSGPLGQVKTSLRFSENTTVINKGNDRPNLHYIVLEQKHASRTFKDLEFALDGTKTIVYFNSINDVLAAGEFLRSRNSGIRIAVFHAVFSDAYKSRVMREFNDNHIDLLLSTEAAGMGCDIGDVKVVIQWGYPSTISSLIQRLGRAARNPDILGQAILFVPSRAPDKAKIDSDIFRYVTTKECRRKVLNDIFDNEDIPRYPEYPCCDICTPFEPPVVNRQEQDDIDDKNNVAEPAANEKPPYQGRTEIEKTCFRLAIKGWRDATFKRDIQSISGCLISAIVITDKNIEILVAKCRHITSPQSVSKLTANTWEAYDETYKDQLGQILVELNIIIQARREREKGRKKEERSRTHSTTVTQEDEDVSSTTGAGARQDISSVSPQIPEPAPIPKRPRHN